MWYVLYYRKFIKKNEGSFNKFHTKWPEILHEHSWLEKRQTQQ